MKILFLNHEFPPMGGGAANATFYLLKEFSSFNDLEINLITSSVDGKFRYESFAKNISLYRVPIGTDEKNIHYKNNKKFINYFFNARKIIKKISKEKKHDLAHAFFAIPAGAIAYSFKNKIPYIVSIRGSDVPNYDTRFSLYYKFLTPAIKRIWKCSEAVVANSEDLKKVALKTNPQQKIDVIYNGVDTKEFYPFQVEKDESLFKIICVAHLIQRKGIEYLIEAVSKLTKTFPFARLTIVGIGDLEKELKDRTKKFQIEKYVEFKGLVNHSNLPTLYNRANVFVLSSLNEGMSNAALEAIACGLPVILTDTGGTKELVKNNGFIVPSKDSQTIAQKIKELIENKELRKKMGLRSRQLAEKMSWKKVAEEYFKIYNKIIKSN